MDIDRIKEAASGNWIELLAGAGCPLEFLDGRHHPCPKCGGDDRFRLIDEAAGAVLCNRCFREKNGDGLSAIGWLLGKPFKDAAAWTASQLGLPTNGAARKRSRGELEDLDWNRSVAGNWARHKPGVTVDALELAGAKLAHWTWSGERYHVVALPIRGKGKLPRGWAMYNSTGLPLPTRSGEKKIVCTAGSETGWLGPVDRLLDATVVWKVEGVSDMLALTAAIGDAPHVALSNPFGAGEKPKSVHLDPLTGKTVVVVADRDQVGREGAERWAAEIARVAGKCYLVDPPGEGKDLRDWIVQGGTYDELRVIAKASPLVESPEAGEDDPDELLHDDDPQRLARAFARQRLERIRYWREDAYRWEGGAWKAMSRDDLRQLVTLFVAEELRRIAEERAAEKNKSDAPKKATKLTRALVESVITCWRAISGVSSAVDWGTEIERDEGRVWRPREGDTRRLVAFRNGILDVDRILACELPELEPHSPDWWSPHVLPYDYDPAAKIGPHWASFLRRNLRGDDAIIDLLQEWMGYCLIPWTGLQRFLVLEGEGGNGKSVYQAALEAVVGSPNVAHVRLELLGERFQTSELLGKLVNITDECGRMDGIAESVLRAIASGQRVTLERKGRDAYSTLLPVRLCLAWNTRPRFHDRSNATWRRMILVNLVHTVPPEERILDMDKPTWWAARPASELSGLFNWAMDGLMRLRDRGDFEIPYECQAAVEEFRESTNPAQEFLAEHLVAEADGEVSVADTYARYRVWSTENGYKPLGNSQFGMEVRRVFPATKKTRPRFGDGRRHIYIGLRWI